MAIERITPSNQEEWRRVGLHHLQRYEFTGRFVAGRRVLDIACGNGYGSYALMSCGAISVEGVDLDRSAIDYALQHYKREGLRYECRDAFSQPPVPGGYDVVVSFETIEHLHNPGEFISKLRRIISDQGLLVISAPNTLQYQKAEPPVENPFHLSEPTYDEFRSWVEQDFRIEQEWEQSPVTMNFNLQAEWLGYSAFARLLLSFERWVKTLIGSAGLRAADRRTARRASYCEVTTEIHALLPERRYSADVFIFVCRPK
jgi:SAM-dependent methyltransferase